MSETVQGIILSRHEEERTTEDNDDILSDIAQHSALSAQTGISRQQLINRSFLSCILSSLIVKILNTHYTSPDTPQILRYAEFGTNSRTLKNLANV